MILHVINGLRIRTHFEFPPIPDRRFDYCATEDDYEPGRPIGWGRTEKDAIDDLLEQIGDET